MDLTSHSAAAPTQFIFPILKQSDIIQCMAELGIDLSKAELIEPGRHKDKIRKVFLQLLDICCGLSEEDLAKTLAKEAATTISQHPSTHDDFTDLKFFLELRKCMETCGLYDFGWKDLHAPTAKRFRCQLSAAINMAKFREDQLKLYAELNEPRTEMLMALEEVNEENGQLNQQLESTQQESYDKFEEMEEMEQECAELESEIARNNKLQAAKREEATELKKSHNDLKNDLATSSLALEEAQVEYESLQTKVVSSPGRRKREWQDSKTALEFERTEAKSLDEKLQQAKAKVMHLSQAIKDIPEATQLMEEVLEGAKKESAVEDQCNAARSDKQAMAKKTSTVREEMEEVERDLYRAEEKLAHMRKQQKVKMDAAQEALDTAQTQLLEVEKDHLDGMARVDAGEAEVKAMEAQIEEERKHVQEEIAQMIQDYRETERVILEQNAQLMTAIGAN